jgi:hypothetical protein
VELLQHAEAVSVSTFGGVISPLSVSTCSNVVSSSPYSVSHSRWLAASRTEATSRARVVTPGNSTRRSRSQPTEASNNAFGPSPVVQARASTQPRSSASAWAKSV